MEHNTAITTETISQRLRELGHEPAPVCERLIAEYLSYNHRMGEPRGMSLASWINRHSGLTGGFMEMRKRMLTRLLWVARRGRSIRGGEAWYPKIN